MLKDKFSLDESSTITVTIFIAGSLEAIRESCRRYCNNVGMCVTVTSTDFVFTGGVEAGAAIGTINYPRTDESTLLQRAEELARQVCLDCHQASYTIQSPQGTKWYSRRP